MATTGSSGAEAAGQAFTWLQTACQTIVDAAAVVPVVRVLVDATPELTEVQRQSVTAMCDIVTKAAFDLIRLAKLGEAMRQEAGGG